MMMEELNRLIKVRNNNPTELFAELEKIASSRLPIKLFSVMEIDFQKDEARRIYTNSPEVYPVSGTKPIPENDWADTVIKRKKIFVANDYLTLKQTFPDHEVIKSLGCEAIINVPITIEEDILGTLNILGPEGAYPPDVIPFAEDLKILGALCFLFNGSIKNG